MLEEIEAYLRRADRVPGITARGIADLGKICKKTDSVERQSDKVVGTECGGLAGASWAQEVEGAQRPGRLEAGSLFPAQLLSRQRIQPKK